MPSRRLSSSVLPSLLLITSPIPFEAANQAVRQAVRKAVRRQIHFSQQTTVHLSRSISTEDPSWKTSRLRDSRMEPSSRGVAIDVLLHDNIKSASIECLTRAS